MRNNNKNMIPPFLPENEKERLAREIYVRKFGLSGAFTGKEMTAAGANVFTVVTIPFYKEC